MAYSSLYGRLVPANARGAQRMCGFSCTKAEKQQLVFRQAKPRDLPDIKRMVRKDRCYATVRDKPSWTLYRAVSCRRR
ncbi:hypothetical protein ABBQ38_012284 [Trebouxia sp. C0009 RCD-2024]